MQPDREALLALEARVVAATGPDRFLDADIHTQLFGTVETHLGTTYRDAFDPLRGHSHPYRFTEHVDGAEMALPGPEWPEYQITRRFGTGYHANIATGADGEGCESAALALAAASLRAIAANQGASL